MAIPKLRRGSYFPDWLLDPRRRAEKALVAVVAECYVRGVSTRRVDGLVKTLGREPAPRRRALDVCVDGPPDPEGPRGAAASSTSARTPR